MAITNHERAGAVAIESQTTGGLKPWREVVTPYHDVIRRKKLIEVALPLEAINEEGSQRKRKAPAGYPTTLHKWWAQRPVAAARAVIFAQMVDDPAAHPESFATEEAQEHERERLFGMIRELVKWENTNDENVLGAARAEILRSWRTTCADNINHPQAEVLFNPERLPAFYDPFAGSGALPLEAQRLGLESFASDLNPVAVLITKAMIEFPSRFAGVPPINPEARREKALLQRQWCAGQGLAQDLLYYGKLICDEAEERIGDLFPDVIITDEMTEDRPDLKPLIGKTLPVIAWLWARTVESPNPAFAGVDVPLVSNFMLSAKAGKEACLEPIVEGRSYRFAVKVGKPKNLDAVKKGTKAAARGADFLCVMSGAPISGDYIKAEGQAGRMGTRLMAIVAEGERGRVYLPPTEEHEAIARRAKPSWQPPGEVPARLTGGTCVPYGLKHWGDLFTSRQLLALDTFSKLVLEVREKSKLDALDSGISDDSKPLESGGAGCQAYADALAVYLSFAISRMADYGSTLSTWRPKDSAMRSSLAKQALPMTWDFAEASVFGDSSGGFLPCVRVVAKAITTSLNCIAHGKAFQADAAASNPGKPATALVSTDPPYYSNIGYADLADFLYVWLRRSLKGVLPDLFALIEVPKTEELVASRYRHGGEERAKAFFLHGMTEAMRILALISHPAFPVTIYYAFMQSDSASDGTTTNTAWETFLGAVVRAGFSISGTWPVRTEGDNRQVGIGANALASSIVLVCRTSDANAPTITRREFINALKAELPAAIAHLQRGNLAPVDLAQAAIGPGMAVFTRYSKVIDAEGAQLAVHDALTLINQVLDEGLAEQEVDFDAESRFAIAWFEQIGFAEGEFGMADVLARAKNTTVAALVDAGIAASRGGKVRLLKAEELDPNWDPTKDRHLTVWQVAHHLIFALGVGGERSAASLVAKLRAHTEYARDLAYRLFNIAEHKKRASEALLYNGLVQSWPEIVRLSSDLSTEQPVQTDLLGAL